MSCIDTVVVIHGVGVGLMSMITCLELLSLEAISLFYKSCKARGSLSKELLTNVKGYPAKAKL